MSQHWLPHTPLKVEGVYTSKGVQPLNQRSSRLCLVCSDYTKAEITSILKQTIFLVDGALAFNVVFTTSAERPECHTSWQGWRIALAPAIGGSSNYQEGNQVRKPDPSRPAWPTPEGELWLGGLWLEPWESPEEREHMTFLPRLYHAIPPQSCA